MQLTNAMDYNDRGSKRHFQEKIDLKGGAKFLDLLVEKRDGFFFMHFTQSDEIDLYTQYNSHLLLYVTSF